MIIEPATGKVRSLSLGWKVCWGNFRAIQTPLAQIKKFKTVIVKLRLAKLKHFILSTPNLDHSYELEELLQKGNGHLKPLTF